MPVNRCERPASPIRLPRALSMLAAALLAAPGLAAAEPMELVTPDGRRVLLKDDQTWEYIEGASEEAATEAPVETAPLELVSSKDVVRGCRFGLRLTNELGYEIRSIVPQFTAVTDGGVSFRTEFQSFNALKPTASQYQEIEFRGISCDAIRELRVSGGDRCTMGELTKFSPERGVCLSRIRLLESDLLTFSK